MRAKLIQRMAAADIAVAFPDITLELGIIRTMHDEWKLDAHKDSRNGMRLSFSIRRHCHRLGERLLAKGGPVLLRVASQLMYDEADYHPAFRQHVFAIWESLGPADDHGEPTGPRASHPSWPAMSTAEAQKIERARQLSKPTSFTLKPFSPQRAAQVRAQDHARQLEERFARRD
jgi:hypothetical protein